MYRFRLTFAIDCNWPVFSPMNSPEAFELHFNTWKQKSIFDMPVIIKISKYKLLDYWYEVADMKWMPIYV